MTAQNEAWPFREPVKAEEVPDYYTLVKVCSPSAPLSLPPTLLPSGCADTVPQTVHC